MPYRVVKPGGFVGSLRGPADIKGLLYHMAESGTGRKVCDYLAGNPTRGVSVQYTIELDGEIVAMVPENRVAGSLNPDALRDDDGPYFGRSHLDYVLGKSNVGNPNRYVIAVEMGGKAVNGPNEKQVTAAVLLFRDCRKRYPNIKPLGHRDQQDVKPCPGSTVPIKLMFELMGGHGKDYRKETIVSTVGYREDEYATLKDKAPLFEVIGDEAFANAGEPLTRPTFGTTKDKRWRLVGADSPGDPDSKLDRTAWVKASDVTSVKVVPPAAPDLDLVIKSARKGAIDQAVLAVQSVVP